MNLIYVYSLKWDLLAQFHAVNGYGIENIGGANIIPSNQLPWYVKTNLVCQNPTVIVMRMD
jgi:hypothetical protein